MQTFYKPIGARNLCLLLTSRVGVEKSGKYRNGRLKGNFG